MRLLRPGDQVRIVVVIPAFNVGMLIGRVLEEIPDQIANIIVVDDGSQDDTAAVVERMAASDTRIELIRQPHNGGVGSAMVAGFKRALEISADIVVKIDGDGQMPPALLPKLVHDLVLGNADYTKGNRFRDFRAIRKMPPLRRFGNVALSFLVKAATGYWHCFDPTNGYVAIRGDVLSRLPLHEIDSSYFFEISMLSHLYLHGAVVKEEPMPAYYAGEPSSLSIAAVLFQFPARLLRAFVRRMFLKNFVYDFSVESLEILAGTTFFGAGVIFGGYKWYWYASHHLAAPTGTVAIAAVLIILGFQSLLSATALDLQAVPDEPINQGPLVKFTRVEQAKETSQ